MHSRSSAPPPVRFRLVPKPGGARVLTRLDPALSAAYGRVVALAAPAVERALGGEVLASRVARVCDTPPDVALAPWRAARAAFERAVRGWPPGVVVLRADVRDCFATISPPAVRGALQRVGAPASAACALVLEELATHGVLGLPAGPPPSAVLANAVLEAGDAALRRAGLPFVRWVDDWWIALPSRAHAALAVDLLAVSIGRDGLSLNGRKTRLVGLPDADGPGSGPEYHRPAHAHAVPLVGGADAVVPGDLGVAVGGRATRGARGQR